jgi:hypothetical protein
MRILVDMRRRVTDGISRQPIAVLGIDAAWTLGEPSGVALLERVESRWRSVAVAPSYSSFLNLALGKPIDWRARQRGGKPDPGALLDALLSSQAHR